MTNSMIRKLNDDASRLYYAMKDGIKLDVYKEEVHRDIDMLKSLGVPQERLEDIMSDAALRVL